MTSYKAPIADIMFALRDVLDAETRLGELPTHENIALEDVQAIVTEAGKLCESVIAPMNLTSDQKGCELVDGSVIMPGEFRKAFESYRDGGWVGITCDEEHGGLGLPMIVNFLVQEMVGSASLSFWDTAGIFGIIYDMVKAFAPDHAKARYLEALAQGKIAGTMCMTEPNCGSDLGMARTKAEPQSDGTYKLKGTKVFISLGDHDLTQNIVHLVIARVVGEQDGVKGLSLFLVPKYWPNEDGTEERNAVHAVSLEHKMGYSSSPTCQMNFENARGWIMGEMNRGLIAMFRLVGTARVLVGSQGLCTAEAAKQRAIAYANERIQGRQPSGARFPEQPADPIIVHPDVRRVLLKAKAFTEAARIWYLDAGLCIDESEHHPSEVKRHEASLWLNLMNSPIKAVLSDMGYDVCNDCLHLFGGYGYIRETGMEILVRDAKIAQIHEGANGMLAFDLIRRQLLLGDKGGYPQFIAQIRQALSRAQDKAETIEFVEPLELSLNRLEEATVFVLDIAQTDSDAVAAIAVEYCRLFGLVVLGYMWLQIVKAVYKSISISSEFKQSKLATARFFMNAMLPMTQGHLAIIQSGSQPTLVDEALIV